MAARKHGEQKVYPAVTPQPNPGLSSPPPAAVFKKALDLRQPPAELTEAQVMEAFDFLDEWAKKEAWTRSAPALAESLSISIELARQTVFHWLAVRQPAPPAPALLKKKAGLQPVSQGEAG